MEQRVTQENIFGSKIIGKGKKKNLDNGKYNKSKSEIADWLEKPPGSLTGQIVAVLAGHPVNLPGERGHRPQDQLKRYRGSNHKNDKYKASKCYCKTQNPEPYSRWFT